MKKTINLWIAAFVLFIAFNMFIKIKKETYTNKVFRSEQSCIDDNIVSNYNNGVDENGKEQIRDKLEALYEESKKYCQSSTCKDTECLYKKQINLEKHTPKKIHGEHVKINDDNIFISWFKPETNYKYPVLKYICIIEDKTNNTTEIQIPNMSKNDLQEYFVRNLNKNTIYDIKLYSENMIGLSEPLAINNLSLQSKTDTNIDEKVKKNEYSNPIEENVKHEFDQQNFTNNEYLYIH